MYKLAEQVCHTVLLMNSFQTSLLVSKYQFFFFLKKLASIDHGGWRATPLSKYRLYFCYFRRLPQGLPEFYIAS